MRTHFHHTPEHRRKIAEAIQGENHWLAKLTADDARRIYALKGRMTASRVCALFDDIIQIQTVYAIWQGLNWSHATGATKKPRRARRAA